ncbi:MAG: glycoside hydrolase family 65 protein [bacterium]
MKDYYSKHKTEYPWLIKEEGWVKLLQGVRESQLALGNGFLGSRAVLEEIPYNAQPGTYVAGVYDRIGSQVAELVNLPNPFNFKIGIDGERLGVITMDVVEHRRILNLRHGLLCRRTIYQDSKKRKYDYQSLRFVSMHDKNIGVMQIIFTPLDNGVEASIETGIDTSVYNVRTVTEGRKRHFRVKELGQFKNEGYLIVETFGKLHTAIFRSGFYYETRGKKTEAKDNIFELKLRKKQTVVFTKVFCVEAASKEENLDKIKRLSEKNFRKAFQSSFDCLLRRHIRAWEGLWNVAEVSIWGDPEVEKNFRFNIYHMLTCGPKDNGASSIGARALTGEGYRGHIFWDTEIFLLPFYLYTLPDIAKNMLLYRYRRLDVARARAKKNGFKGAMFPWESAGLGGDETPGWAKDLDGKVIRIHTGKMEHHITADIAYAFYHYYNATQDEKFFRDYGYEIFFETARFWASRVEYNKRKKKYEIKQVIGPDEFHIDVNNNAFTNMMAKWNLAIAYNLFQKIKKSNPEYCRKLVQKIGLSAKEAAEWKSISARISINSDKRQVIEQFDGYFRKRRIKITGWDENFVPVVSEKLTPRDYGKTQLVKQADVIMLLYLLSDVFSIKTKKENYAYYIDRTIHKSSLSLPIYALVAIDVGDKSRGYRFFHTALRTDISNINNNTYEGIHAACMGGSWQVLINGFAGVKIQKGILSVNPKMPRIWRKILFSLHWRGILLRLEVKNNKVKIRLVSPGRKKVKIRVFGILCSLAGDKPFEFERKRPAKELEAYYL